MSDLVEFLNARFGEDERAAREARGKRWHIGNAIDPTKPCNIHEFPTVRLIADNCGWLEAEHIARWNPERVLAEVEAKRRLLEQFRLRGDSVRSTVQPSTGGVWDDLLRMLALPYADHPDYRQEWRP